MGRHPHAPPPSVNGESAPKHSDRILYLLGSQRDPTCNSCPYWQHTTSIYRSPRLFNLGGEGPHWGDRLPPHRFRRSLRDDSWKAEVS